MNALVAITRTVLIGFIWSLLFFIGLQAVMVYFWNFNPFRPDHWIYVWNLWLSGWVISSAREVVFFIALFAIIPIWLTGWTTACLIPWKAVFVFPFICLKKYLFTKKIAKKPALKRKLSYKKTRPPAVRTKIKKPAAAEPTPAIEETKAEAPKKPQAQEISQDYKPAAASKPSQTKAAAPAKKAASVDSIEDIIKDANYDVLNNAKIGNNEIDFIAVAKENIILCLVDSEDGDWLADEERFNDEDPLWFSENSHRVSPVRKVIDSKEATIEKMSEIGEKVNVQAMVILSNGTIINAEDMFEIWDDLNVMVSRVGDGGPDEIKVLEDVLPKNSSDKADDDLIEKLKKALKI